MSQVETEKSWKADRRAAVAVSRSLEADSHVNTANIRPVTALSLHLTASEHHTQLFDKHFFLIHTHAGTLVQRMDTVTTVLLIGSFADTKQLKKEENTSCSRYSKGDIA